MECWEIYLKNHNRGLVHQKGPNSSMKQNRSARLFIFIFIFAIFQLVTISLLNIKIEQWHHESSQVTILSPLQLKILGTPLILESIYWRTLFVVFLKLPFSQELNLSVHSHGSCNSYFSSLCVLIPSPWILKSSVISQVLPSLTSLDLSTNTLSSAKKVHQGTSLSMSN